MENLAIFGAGMVVLGSIVLLIAAIGLIRMPDAYNRIQVGTKASTAAVALIMLGLTMVVPSWFGKLFTIMLFVLLTNPVSSNVLMRAAHKIGIPMAKQTVVDHLKEDEEKPQDHGKI